MNGSWMIKACTVLFAAAPVFAQDVATLYGDWSEKGVFKWTDAAGKATDWVDGSVAHVTAQYNGNVGGGPFNAYGFVFAYGGCKGYWTDNSRRTVGAGGMTFLSDGTYACGKNDFNTRLFGISADQEWKGPAGEGAYADLSIGYPGYGDYWKMPLLVGSEVGSIGISGRLNVWLSSPSNDLSGVEVKVSSPARLYLPSAYPRNGKIFDARLRAGKLTLSGEGSEMLALGGTAMFLSSPSAVMDNLRVLDADHVADEIVLENGADLHAASRTIFAVPTLRVRGGESELGGEFAVTQELTRVELSDGATLRISAKLTEQEGVAAAVSVTGSGTLIVDADNYGLSGELSLGEDVDLLIEGKGKLELPFSGGGNVTVSGKDGGIFYVPSSVVARMNDGNVFTVASGTIMLERRSDDLGLVVAAGAEVVYGEDNEYIVTDLPRSETSITLDGIHPLEIYGDGLTAATKLNFVSGTNLVFRTSAVVASPIEISGVNYRSARCLSDESVTGTISGRVKILANKVKFVLSGPGAFRLCGGFDLGPEGCFLIDGDASAVLAGDHEYIVPGYGDVVIGREETDKSGPWGRYLAVRDGAHLKMQKAAGYKRIMFAFRPTVNSSGYNNESTLEVGNGGTVTFPEDGFVQIGGNQSIGRLVVSGGTVNVGKNSCFCVGYGQYSTGYLHLDSGRINLSSPFSLCETSDTCFIKWNGGTIAVMEDFSGQSLFDGVFSNGIEGSRRFSVEIAGDCTFDLTDSPCQVFTNMTATTNRGEWYGNGSLTVKGGKTLLMRSMPDTVALRTQGEGTVIAIDGETRVFNYGVCATNCVWRRPYPVANAEYSSLGSQTNELCIASFSVADGCGGLVDLSQAHTVSVPEAFVEPLGVWNNSRALCGEGISLGNLTFAKGAGLTVDVAGFRTPTLGLSGILKFPDGEVVFRANRGGLPNGEDETVFSAAQGVSGVPQWTKAGTRIKPVIDGGRLYLEFPGSVITVR